MLPTNHIVLIFTCEKKKTQCKASTLPLDISLIIKTRSSIGAPTACCVDILWTSRVGVLLSLSRFLPHPSPCPSRPQPPCIFSDLSVLFFVDLPAPPIYCICSVDICAAVQIQYCRHPVHFHIQILPCCPQFPCTFAHENCGRPPPGPATIGFFLEVLEPPYHP